MIARVLLLLFLLTPGCISEKDSSDIDTSALVLESGDFVKMDFVGRIEETGEVFDTTYADVAFNPDIEKMDRFTFADNYEPMSFTLGKGQILPALEANMVGMKIGEVENITLTPEEGYGDWSTEYTISLPRIAVLPKLTDVLISEFIGATGREPELNETIPLNYWNVSVVNISEPNMTLLHAPDNNTVVMTEYGPAIVTLNDTHVTTNLTPELGSVITRNLASGVISDVNGTDFVIDFNHPLAGKTLVFEVTVRDIIKAKHILGQKIAWTDYETGINIAKNEKKPVVIVFYLEGCSACEAMDAITFSNPEVLELKDRFIWIKVDGDSESAISEEYGAAVYPTVALLDENGEVVEMITGYILPYDLKKVIEVLGLGEKV
jgi:FKBP-type peptidyl-prolyl cis-trans isomerase 2